MTVKLATAAKTKAAPAQQAAAKEAATELAADLRSLHLWYPPATPSDVGDDGLPPPLLDPGSDTPRQPALKRPATSS